jgi:TetR/AcrR family tetracycline transcriptional repressor
VPGVAGILQTSAGSEAARRLDRLSRSLLREAGLAKAGAAAAHAVLYTYLLGSISLEESRTTVGAPRGRRQTGAQFRAGLDVIVAGITASEQR